MRLFLMVLGVMALSLAGCGASGGTAGAPNEEATPGASGGGPAGQPATAAPEPAQPTTDSSIGQVAPARTVVLADVTPASGGTSEPIEQPRPGVPDPRVALAGLASQDLATRLKIDVSAVRLVEVHDMEWPDSSLGCPDPDGMYLTVITPGYQIVLEAEGKQYTYHTDTGQRAVLCENGKPAQ